VGTPVFNHEFSLLATGGFEKADSDLDGGDTNDPATAHVDTGKTTTQAVGYVLSDDDPGDAFTLNVKQDARYPTPIFEVLGGRSSNPWEPWYEYKDENDKLVPDESKPAMVPRDKAVISVDPDSPGLPPRTIPPGEEATFTLLLKNDSQSGEAREYHLRSIQTSNPHGAVIKVNGSTLDVPLSFFIEPQGELPVTMTVARGPRRFSYEDLQLMLYPPGEYALWEDGGPGLPPRLSDVVSFDVDFESPCSDIELFRPQPGWTFNQIDQGSPLELILDDFDLSDNRLQHIEVQYRRQGHEHQVPGPWQPLRTVEANNLTQGQSHTINWNLHNEEPDDGVFDLRAFTVCESGRVNSALAPGTVDRRAPQVLGAPQPADGRLSLGETIALNFDELVQCDQLDPANDLALTNLSDNSAVAIASTSCDGRTVFIEPADLDALEGVQLEAHVANLTDLLGNPMDARTWQFWVRRRAFVWDRSPLTADVDLGKGAVIEATLVNGSEQVAPYSLTMPDWLVAAEPDGTLPPGGTQVIHFTVADDLPEGPQSDTVIAQAQNLGTAVLQVDLDVACRPPVWAVDLNEFEHSMNIFAELFINGELARESDGPDRVAAFVGDEIRGVAEVELVANLGHQINLTVYSNELEGEIVRFEVWDTDACFNYPQTDQSFLFADGAVIGTPNSPIVMNALLGGPSPQLADFALTQRLELKQGWNWVSFNLHGEDMSLNRVFSRLFLRPGDLIRGINERNTVGLDLAWGGDGLQAVDARAGYMIKLQDPAVLTVIGKRVDPQTPIPLTPGWNWISYLPQQPLDVNEALAGYRAGVGDLIKSQDEFA